MSEFGIGDKVRKKDGTRFRDGASVLTVSKTLLLNSSKNRYQIWFKETNTWLCNVDLEHVWPYDDKEVI